MSRLADAVAAVTIIIEKIKEGRQAMEERAKLTDWGIVLLLMGAMIFSLLDRLVLSVLLEPIKQDLGLSDGHLGLLTGVAFGLFYATMALPLGWLADRWTRKGTILAGMSLWGAATAASGFAGNYAQLFLARVGVGAGEAALSPASYSIIYDRFPRALLARAMSLFQSGAMLGSGVALITAGAMYDFFRHGGGAALPFISHLRPWQQTFIGVATPGLVLIVAIAIFMPEPKKKFGESQLKRASLLSSFRENTFVYITLFGGAIGNVAAFYSMLTWLPSIIVREYGWEPSQIGWLYGSIVAVCSTTGLMTGGWLADYLQWRGVSHPYARIPLIAGLSSLPLMVLLGVSSTAFSTLIVAGLLHLVLVMPFGVIPAYIQVIAAPNARGQLSALYVITTNFSALGVAPVFIGFLSDNLAGGEAALRYSVVAVSISFLVPCCFACWHLICHLNEKPSSVRPGPEA